MFASTPSFQLSITPEKQDYRNGGNSVGFVLIGPQLLAARPTTAPSPTAQRYPAHLRILAAQSGDCPAVADASNHFEHLGVASFRCPQWEWGLPRTDLASGNAGDNLSCLAAGDLVGGRCQTFAEKLLAAAPSASTANPAISSSATCCSPPRGWQGHASLPCMQTRQPRRTEQVSMKRPGHDSVGDGERLDVLLDLVLLSKCGMPVWRSALPTEVKTKCIVPTPLPRRRW